MGLFFNFLINFFFMQETFNLQNTILQTLLTMQVSLRYYLQNNTYELQCGLLMLTIQY